MCVCVCVCVCHKAANEKGWALISKESENLPNCSLQDLFFQSTVLAQNLHWSLMLFIHLFCGHNKWEPTSFSASKMYYSRVCLLTLMSRSAVCGILLANFSVPNYVMIHVKCRQDIFCSFGLVRETDVTNVTQNRMLKAKLLIRFAFFNEHRIRRHIHLSHGFIFSALDTLYYGRKLVCELGLGLGY